MTKMWQSVIYFSLNHKMHMVDDIRGIHFLIYCQDEIKRKF